MDLEAVEGLDYDLVASAAVGAEAAVAMKSYWVAAMEAAQWAAAREHIDSCSQREEVLPLVVEPAALTEYSLVAASLWPQHDMR